MCDPISLAVIAVVSTASTVFGQIKSAKAQTKAIRNQQGVVREETRQVASAELFDQMRATRREQARTRVAAGEAGLSLSSGSVEALLLDSATQGTFKADRTIANMESRHASNTAEASVALSRIQKPTALGAGIQIGLAGAQAYGGAVARQG